MAAVAGYLLGSIPFGVVIARLFGLGDLRRIGSGNIGATNVLRTGNKAAAAATLVLDAGKGAAAVLIARALGAEDAAQLAGAAAFLGHLFPVWLGFRGGKGVATWLGLMLALSLPVGLFACATWLFTAVVFRYSSLAALAASALTPLAAWIFDLGAGRSVALVSLVLAALIWQRHAANIRRLAKGEEPRIGATKGASP
jgi:glycerol-3-phosphate acyltransferase PlsY